MESLRDIGYELPAAVADLIDNSVDAQATEVDVSVAFAGSDSWIRVADNGTGMPVARMNEAMRYGTERDYTTSELGKFGLGLKTASLSQCRRLTVASRTNPDRREIEVRRWDLEHVIQRDRWELIRPLKSELHPELLRPLRETTGTVVMWERLDRVLSYKLPIGVAAEHGLAALCREIEEHLAMVFHRFLSGQAKRTLPLTIRVNGNAVDAWDPYARKERATQKLERQVLSVREGGRTHPVVVQPYILPNQMQFSTVRAWEAASGPKKWNRQQGFYMYRSDRMIQSGGWSRLRTPDEHTKLARIAVDIPREADTTFEINVSKMRVIIPGSIRGEMKAIASGVVNKAQTAYRQREARPPRSGGRRARDEEGGWGPSGATDGTADASGNGQGAGVGGSLLPWSVVVAVLEDELGSDPDLLKRVVAALRAATTGRPHQDAARA